MAGCICVYLHGFLSSENSKKGQWFKHRLSSLISGNPEESNCTVLTPSYPMNSPHDTVRFLTNFLNQAGLANSNKKWFIVGASMGGFYAQHLAQQFNVPFIMINPALDPVSLFDAYAGQHVNPHTGEVIIIDQAYQEALSKYYQQPNEQITSLLLLDKDDEVIGYQLALDRYQTGSAKHTCKVFPGGDHAFQHLEESSLEIKQFIERVSLKAVTN